MKAQDDQWAKTLNKQLPRLALVGPFFFLSASLVRAFGIGTLPGELSWVSSYEGLLMTIGAPFFVATFIFMGREIAHRSPKAGVAVTVLGVLGTAFITFISSFRALAGGLVAQGVDPKMVNGGLESEASMIWLSALLLYNFCYLLSWILTGVEIMRKGVAPWWVGVAFLLSIPSLVTGQALYYHLEIFWPLANALWLSGVWGFARSARRA